MYVSWNIARSRISMIIDQQNEREIFRANEIGCVFL